MELNRNNLYSIIPMNETTSINKNEIDNIISENELKTKIHYIDYCIDEDNKLFYREYVNTNIIYEINFNNDNDYKIILSFQFEENETFINKSAISIGDTTFRITNFTNINKNFVNKKYVENKNITTYNYIDIEMDKDIPNNTLQACFSNYNIRTFNSVYYINPIIDKSRYFILSFFLGIVILLLTLFTNNHFTKNLFKVLYLLGTDLKGFIRYFSIDTLYILLNISIVFILMIIITKSVIINSIIFLLIFVFILIINMIFKFINLHKVKNEKTY
ncbi:MAG: hypothetical protein ACOX3U_06755 [Christensenellales bacterium]